MKQFPRDQTVIESGYLPVLHRNLPAALFLFSEEESQNAGGIKAAGPRSMRSDTDKQQMRAATGGGDKRTVLSTAVASAKSQPAGLLHWAFVLIHQNACACSLLRTRARMHTVVSKAGLIFECSHPASAFSLGWCRPEVPGGGLKLWEEWEKLWLRNFSSSLSPSMQRWMCRLLSLHYWNLFPLIVFFGRWRGLCVLLSAFFPAQSNLYF